MKKEDKELLKKVICSMLPYGVKVKITEEGVLSYDNGIGVIVGKEYVDNETYIIQCKNDSYFLTIISEFMPYLRTMSSMTVVEQKDLRRLTDAISIYDDGLEFESHDGCNDYIGYCFCSKIVDWLNAHHFDYCGLIPMGLALEAPEGMYKDE